MTVVAGRSWRVPFRLCLLIAVLLTAVMTSIWRVRSGHRPLPGMFTLVFLPLSILFVVLLDIRFHLTVGEWLAATSLVIVHLVLSVPGDGGPLYYRGTQLIRPDHFVHLFAGGLVAWVACDVLRGTAYGRGLSTGVLAACALLVAVGFGVMKETTDFFSVKATGARHDSFDAIAYSCANIVGAGAAVWWRLRSEPRGRGPGYGEREPRHA